MGDINKDIKRFGRALGRYERASPVSEGGGRANKATADKMAAIHLAARGPRTAAKVMNQESREVRRKDRAAFGEKAKSENFGK